MSESPESKARAERIARYKAERKKQLAAQFGSHYDTNQQSPTASTTRIAIRKTSKDSGSSSEGPRPTRTSHLRALTRSQDNISSQSQRSSNLNLTDISSSINGNEAQKSSINRRVERDKSSKRKSNLNRSLTSEEVPPANDISDPKNRRRRRRFFPTDLLEQHQKESTTNEKTTKSDTTTTAPLSFALPSSISKTTTTTTIASNVSSSILSNLPMSTSQTTSSATITASTITNGKNDKIPKSQLSIHMENARKGVTPSYSEMGSKYKPYSQRRASTASPRANASSPKPTTEFAEERKTSNHNKENLRRKLDGVTHSFSDNDDKRHSRNIAKRMEELTAITKETLARVERLANKTKDLPRKDISSSNSRLVRNSPIRQLDKFKPQEKTARSSILKHKKEEVVFATAISHPVITTSTTTASTCPVSILKRKVDDKSDAHSSNHTPPVTFSPSVVEPTTTNRKQGILKKRRSLDESQVLRHRSCSPDVANKSDSRSILKNQRRSSMEELTRTQSPEIQGILKRKTSRNEDDDHSLNSPQSILKRRSGASSAGSTSSTPHVSITTAVILAAAGGAEMVLEPEAEAVKPILKKKSISEDHSYSDSSFSEPPKPILKKKSSTDTDDYEGEGGSKPRPILKLPRSSLERDHSRDRDSNGENDMDVRSILKSQTRDENRPRLSFCGDNGEQVKRQRSSRRSHTICAEFTSNTTYEKEEDRLLKQARPLSVHELVKSFEKNTESTGAIPKRTSFQKRNSDRYRTQPITSNELEASLNSINTPNTSNLKISETHNNRSQFLSTSPHRLSLDSNHSAHSLLDFTSSSLLEDDSNLNSFLSSSSTSFHHNNPISPDSPGASNKMSSDSAFQSLGDGLELEQEEDDNKISVTKENKSGNISSSTIVGKKLEPSKLESQMKAIAEEAKKMRLKNAGVDKYRSKRSEGQGSSRFSTQPVTVEEVKKASKQNHDSDDYADDQDPCNLSLCEKIDLFKKMNMSLESSFNSCDKKSSIVMKTHYRKSLNFLIDDPDEKDIAKSKFLDKSPTTFAKKSYGSSAAGNSSRKSILKNDSENVHVDEGISCNDSGSDSELSTSAPEKETISTNLSKITSSLKSSEQSTSEGESSGGREVKSIFKGENKLKLKQTLESVLSKSKSQTTFGDDCSSTSIRNSSLRRSQTQSQAAMPQSIADLRARLQESGESEWKKRVPQNNNANDELKALKEKNRYNDELSEKSLLAAKKDELDQAARQWKTRVEKTDAEKFSVAGRLAKTPTIHIPDVNDKKTPQAKRFKSRDSTESSSTPASPEKNGTFDLTRSKSALLDQNNLSANNGTTKLISKTVSVPKPDDFTFQSFYESVRKVKTDEHLDVLVEDFDKVSRESLLVLKKDIQVQRRRGATSRNPIKALASRTDISNEYTEVLTGVAEREKKRLNIEKLSKNSNLAVEALAGLASKEDFKSVALKKNSSPSSVYLPYKRLMLLQIKGRRHVQTRLVEPIASNINEGDCYLLITPTVLYTYIGSYCNVIEQSRAQDIANHIQKTGDMGCKVDKVITISSKSLQKHIDDFWSLLGANKQPEVVGAGHPEEDETYENNILKTNMVYTVENNELVPLDSCWGQMPKFEILEEKNVIVFDFGSELYVWSGKSAPLEKKKLALQLAKEMWEEGYNYSDCNVNPLNVVSILGDRAVTDEDSLSKKADKRPDWALFAKITQHRETVLFREKFLDWPDFSRIIRVKSTDSSGSSSPSDIKAIDGDELFEMVKEKEKNPDMVIEGMHLGRGNEYFDEETNRLFQYDTIEIKAWRILENTYESLSDKSIGQFFDGDSYIYSWRFRSTVKGRELTGKPSKYGQVGRERVCFFCWQGSNSSINEKGTAAFLTVELDKQNAPQIRVVQGSEPAAFLRLFGGNMIIQNGKRDESIADTKKLFLIRGEEESECYLMQVPFEMSSLRSRSSFAIMDLENDVIKIWHGCKSSSQKRKVIKSCVDKLIKNKPNEITFNDFDDVEIKEMDEGDEDDDFYEWFGKDRSVYNSLLDNDTKFDYTLRLFHLTSLTGIFSVSEMLCPHRSEFSSPYPFTQSELYSASQPALFLLDNHHELWLWQGWWPEKEDETELSEQTGSGAVRWQAERRAAMQTALNYWKVKNKDREEVRAHLVWAGLEPLEFTNLFPSWKVYEDVTELNLKEGKSQGEKRNLEKELILLSRTTYPLSELLQRPLPEGVDPTQLEIYLSPEEFEELMSMTKEEFKKMPSWKQTALKKEKGLF